MERKITNDLIKWKNDSNKKPLILYGVSGCGKTYSALDFGKTYYKNTVYFNCTNNMELSYVLEKNNTIEKLTRALSALSLETIFQEETLIVFDNVTEKILNYIKNMFLTNPLYNVICITNNSSLIKSFPEFNIKKLTLVDFPEYLKFISKEQLITFIEDSFKTNKPMPFHSMAVEIFNDYVITGGYPSTIVAYNNERNPYILSSEHEKNIKLMKYKLFNISNLIDIKRSTEILNNISIQLLKENKKFLYGNIKQGGRSKEYDDALNFIEMHDMVIKSTKIKEITKPLSKIKDDDSFKLYYNDSGLLYFRMNVGMNRLLTNEKLLYILYQNNVVQTLHQNGFNLYHYHSEGKAEIDLVVQTRTGKLIPIEFLTSSHTTKSKSLPLAMNKYNLDFAIRLTDDNFKLKNNIKYVPYYACFCIEEGM